MKSFVYTVTSKQANMSKIFDNEDFGYQKITVERPLRLNFLISEERIGQVVEQKAIPKPCNIEEKRR